MADYPQIPVDTKDFRIIASAANTSTRRLNTPVMPEFSVGALPSSQVLRAQLAFATNGRKAGEGPGVGSGVLVFYDGVNWIAVDTGTAVAA